MKIETEALRLAPLNVSQIKINGAIFAGPHAQHQIKLNAHQVEILEYMQQGRSLVEIIQLFLDRGLIPSFGRLTEMIEFLVRERLILNPQFSEYFSDFNKKHQPKNWFERWRDKLLGPKLFDSSQNLGEALKHVPFLRSLDPVVLNGLLKNSRWVQSPSGVAICENGKLQRALFVLLKGRAAVIKTDSNGKKRKIASLSDNAVFGEVGFFLGEARTADVITESDCLVLKIKYVPEIYNGLIQTEKARHLQKRFWLIHALLKSELFRDIPEDCFDALIFAGELKSYPLHTPLCQEGDFGDRCFIVIQGQLVVTQSGNIIRKLGQGDVFGEIALIMTGGKRSASVITEGEVLVLEIPAQKFYHLLAHNLLLAREIEAVALNRIKNPKA